MSRYVLLSWNGGGNEPPAIGLAQALKNGGHDVTFAGYENQRDRFTARGFRFVLLEHSSAQWQDVPPERLFAMKMQTAIASLAHLDDVPQLISREQYDVLVVDCMMFGALAAAESIRVPTVVLVHSPPGAVFPPGGQFESLLLGPVNQARAKAGQPAIKNIWDAWVPFPALCTTIPQLDPLASQTPESFFYLGPIFEQVPPSGWKSPWTHGDGRPLVLVSFSTNPNWNQNSRIERTLKALAHYDCRVVVTAGLADLAEIPVPANTVVVRHIPHAEILPDVAVTVTHAGHGTVAASLMHGVPLLCLPNAVADQPILAAQIEALGAGRALDGDNAIPAEIETAIGQLLNDPCYAANARSLANAIAHAPGTRAAVSYLERLTKTAPGGIPPMLPSP